MNLAAVYSRKIDGRVLTLAPSGWTYNYTFVLFDKESGTLWYPYEKGLKGIEGKYFKKWLPKMSYQDTSWGKWHKAHPQTKILR